MRLLMTDVAQQAAEADRRQAGLADTLVALLLGGSLAAALGASRGERVFCRECSHVESRGRESGDDPGLS